MWNTSSLFFLSDKLMKVCKANTCDFIYFTGTEMEVVANKNRTDSEFSQ